MKGRKGKTMLFHSGECVFKVYTCPARMPDNYWWTAALTCEGQNVASDCEPRGAERPRRAGRKLGRAGVHSRALEQQAGLAGAL